MGYLHIQPPPEFSGEEILPVSVYQDSDDDLFSIYNFSLIIEPVDDPPVVTMLSPLNNSVLDETTVDFSWLLEDTDTGMGNLRAYFAISEVLEELELEMEQIMGNTKTLDDLEEGVRYFWTMPLRGSVAQARSLRTKSMGSERWNSYSLLMNQQGITKQSNWTCGSRSKHHDKQRKSALCDQPQGAGCHSLRNENGAAGSRKAGCLLWNCKVA